MAGLFTAGVIKTLAPTDDYPIEHYRCNLRSYYSEEGSHVEFIVESYDKERIERIITAWTSGQHQLVRDCVNVVSYPNGPEYN